MIPRKKRKLGDSVWEDEREGAIEYEEGVSREICEE